ncbi:MAG: hypothetical protein AB1898_30405 [Acidobacteriota bacterium]
MPITEDLLKEVFPGLISMWSDAKLEDFVLGYTEDVLAVDPRNPVPVRGRKELLDWFKEFKKTFGSFSIRTLHLEMLAPNAFYYEFIMTYAREGEKKRHMLFRPVIIFRESPDGFPISGSGTGMLIRHEQWDMYPCDAQGKRL